jgi:hypothetical protein
VRGALAEVGAQARCCSKVFNDRSKGREIAHMWLDESDYIICIDGGKEQQLNDTTQIFCGTWHKIHQQNGTLAMCIEQPSAPQNELHINFLCKRF